MNKLELLQTDPAYREAEAVLERLAHARTPTLPVRPDVPEELSSTPRTGEEQHWSEAIFRNLMESLPDALVVINSHGAIVLVNEQTEQLFGYKCAELLGQEIEILVPEHFRRDHVAKRNGYFTQPRPRPMGAELELFGRRKDGTEFPVEISLSPLQTPQGVLATSVIRDVSKRKRDEAKFRTLVENIPAVTFIAPLDETPRSCTSARKSSRCWALLRRNGWKTRCCGIASCTPTTGRAGTTSSPRPAPAVSRSAPSTASLPRMAGSSGCRASPASSATRKAIPPFFRAWPSTSPRSRKRRRPCARSTRSWTGASLSGPRR